MSVRVSGDDVVKEYLNKMSRKDIKSAYSAALKKTTIQAKTVAKKTIREAYNIKASKLSKQMTVRRLSFDVYQIVGKGKKGIPMIDFGAKQSGFTTKKFTMPDKKGKRLMRTKRKRGAVTVAIKKGQKKTIKSAFLAQMPSGHIGVFVRRGKKRLHIDEKYSIDVPSMLGSRKVFEKVRKLVRDKFSKIFKHELDRRL